QVVLAVVDRLVRHQQRGVDLGQLGGLERDVDHRADDLNDASHRVGRIIGSSHGCYPLRASAPPMISSSSLVIAAWRARLYWRVSRPIISPALRVALSIALMRAPSSDAVDSSTAR